MSTMESIKKKMAKVKVEVGEKVGILGEKSEECVTVFEKAAKKSLTEMEGTLNFLGERSGECVNLIDRVAKKSLGQLKATLQFQSTCSFNQQHYIHKIEIYEYETFISKINHVFESDITISIRMLF